MATQLGRQPGRAAPGEAVAYLDGAKFTGPVTVGAVTVDGLALHDSENRAALLAFDGGGAIFQGTVFPSGAHGGSTTTDNPSSPTLLDLAALGVPKLLWMPGRGGTSGTDYANMVSTPATITGNDGGGNALPLILDVDIVTNELDPVAGQSNYFLISKPSCFNLYFDETLTPTVKLTDSGAVIQTLPATASLPSKTPIMVRAVILPGGVSGSASVQVQFLTSPDHGVTWSQFGDPVTGGRRVTAYATTSGSPLNVLVGANTYASAYRGAILKAVISAGGTIGDDGTVTGQTVLATMDPTIVSGTPLSWTGPQGNVWTINSPQTTAPQNNWVTQTCLASAGTGGGGSGNDEWVTRNDATQIATVPGLYPTLGALGSGFFWDASKFQCRRDYSANNQLANLDVAPTIEQFVITFDSSGAPVFLTPNATVPSVDTL